MNRSQICAGLEPDDIEYLSLAYELSADFIKGMDDREWCALLGCDTSELPYYLFDEVKPEFADDEESRWQELNDDLALDNWGDETEFGDLAFESDTLFPLDNFISHKPTRSTGASPLVFSEYGKPSRYAKKKKVKPTLPVPHHYELVR